MASVGLPTTGQKWDPMLQGYVPLNFGVPPPGTSGSTGSATSGSSSTSGQNSDGSTYTNSTGSTTSPSYSSESNYGPDGKPISSTSGTFTYNPFEQQQQLLREQASISSQDAAAASDRQLASERAILQARADLNAQSQAQLMGLLNSTGGSAGPQVARESTGGLADDTGARAAAFARAKEQAGQTAQAALTGLRSAVEDRGLMGSSVEAAGVGAAIGGAGGAVNDFTREQLKQDLGRADQLADRNYQGNITQRSQDIAQRGQDLQAKQALQGLLMANKVVY